MEYSGPSSMADIEPDLAQDQTVPCTALFLLLYLCYPLLLPLRHSCQLHSRHSHLLPQRLLPGQIMSSWASKKTPP
ncbi:hypothetical protein SK128_013357, partial [Halocaridina rubra]